MDNEYLKYRISNALDALIAIILFIAIWAGFWFSVFEIKEHIDNKNVDTNVVAKSDENTFSYFKDVDVVIIEK